MRLNLVRRLRNLESRQCRAPKQQPFRTVVSYIGEVAGQGAFQPTCKRTRLTNGTVSEVIYFASKQELEEEALNAGLRAFQSNASRDFSIRSLQVSTDEGSRDQFWRQKEEAIAALLTQRNVEEAAKSIGVTTDARSLDGNPRVRHRLP